MVPKNKFKDIWYYRGYICNLQLKRMWDRVLTIWPTNLSFLITIINSRLPDGSTYVIPWRDHGIQACDINNTLKRIPPHLSFTKEEEEFGRTMLESMGIPSDSSFICFVGRDPLYLKMTYPNEQDNNYHDYRDTDIKKYILAAEEMANRGYYMIRMGAVVLESFESNNRRIIDYATNGTEK